MGGIQREIASPLTDNEKAFVSACLALGAAVLSSKPQVLIPTSVRMVKFAANKLSNTDIQILNEKLSDMGL